MVQTPIYAVSTLALPTRTNVVLNASLGETRSRRQSAAVVSRLNTRGGVNEWLQLVAGVSMAATSALDGLDFQALLRDDGFTLDNDLDTLFVMWATTLVLFMQVPFCTQSSIRSSSFLVRLGTAGFVSVYVLSTRCPKACVLAQVQWRSLRSRANTFAFDADC